MKNKLSWASLLVLVILTVGCGSGQPQPTPQAELLVEATETPTPPPPTPLPPTDTPVPVEPTPTNTLVLAEDTPTPTPVPIAADTPLPPTDTPFPTEEPAPAPPEPGQVASQASGACYNPYFPIRSDTTWRYQLQPAGAAGSQWTLTYKDITPGAFTAVQIFPNFSAEVRWNCTDQGLMSSEFANLKLTDVQGFEFETVDYSGITLPPADQMQVGSSWQNNYKIKATTSGGGMTVETEFEVTTQNQVAAFEQISVPAGTYADGARIDSTGTMVMNVAGTQMETGIYYSTWYVKDVGLVKSSSDDPNGAFAMELVSLE